MTDLHPEFLECMGTLKIEEGDTVVFRMKKTPTNEILKMVSRNAKFLSENYGCRAIFLDKDMEIGLLKNNNSEQSGYHPATSDLDDNNPPPEDSDSK